MTHMTSFIAGHPAHTKNNLEGQHLANVVPYVVHLRYMKVGSVIWRRRGSPIQLYGSQSGKDKGHAVQSTSPMATRQHVRKKPV